MRYAVYAMMKCRIVMVRGGATYAISYPFDDSAFARPRTGVAACERNTPGAQEMRQYDITKLTQDIGWCS